MSAYDLLSLACLLLGVGFCAIGSVGLLRLPDVFTRLHASSLTDTLGAGLVLAGLMLQSGWSLVSAKLLMIFLIILFMSCTTTHAVAKAAFTSGIKPKLGGGTGTVKRT